MNKNLYRMRMNSIKNINKNIKYIINRIVNNKTNIRKILMRE